MVDLIFNKGKSISSYPLRLLYVPLSSSENKKLKIGVSVSKKYFKRAVDRNRFKRMLRETYRLNKHILLQKLDKPYGFILLYQSKNRLTYKDINNKTIALFEKFTDQNN